MTKQGVANDRNQAITYQPLAFSLCDSAVTWKAAVVRRNALTYKRLHAAATPDGLANEALRHEDIDKGWIFFQA